MVPLGLWMRFRSPGPEWLRDASGGALYVICGMLLLALLLPDLPPARLALVAFLGTCGVEFSQAWHRGWLDALRHTLAGRLVLGTTFNWSDFAPYAVGALIGWGALAGLRRPRTPTR